MVKKQVAVVMILSHLIFSEFALAISEEEVKYGFYVDREMVARHTMLFNDSLINKISEIGDKIERASDKSDIKNKYIYRIINSAIPNAASVPGFIYITTGLLENLKDEDEVATIIAHEIAHNSKSHQISFFNGIRDRESTAELRSTIVSELVGLALIGLQTKAYASINTRNLSPNQYGYILSSQRQQRMQIDSTVSKIKASSTIALYESLSRGYTREQELEADKFAVRYTKKAGYSPYALITVLETLKSLGDGGSVSNKLVSSKTNYVSHLINAEPGIEERMKNIKNIILEVSSEK